MTRANKAKLKKKTTTPISQKNGSHNQDTAISPSRLPTARPEISSSTTLLVSTPNTNQYQEQCQELKNRIIALESRVEFLETQLLITQNVSKHLEKRLNGQEQYSRRPCLDVSGMMEPGKEDDHDSDCEKIITTLSKETGIRKDFIKENIDKIHLLGKPNEEGRQLRIVKFTSDSFKETIYRRHKNRIETYTSDQRKRKFPIKINIKLQPSLTSQRLKLLKIARDRTSEMEEVKFPHAEVHGNLKFILNTPVKNRYVIDFKTEEDITNLIYSLGLNTDLVDEDCRKYEN